ncbi:MAG: ATP-dependent zinc metalloprotease FtsH [Candidatus Enterosoma sp.]|nr:ATP-dependent zinc metalloprotease FtsH [bacterium]MDY5909263.1 ATP-dependent zinc metalloprotease FtsH [Candidatus Enterosoma sp.]
MRKYQLHDPGNQSYEMKFSDDQNDNGREDPRRDPSSGEKRKGGVLSLVLLALAFIALVSGMLYFLVFRSSNNMKTFSENAIAFNVDYDKNDETMDSLTEIDEHSGQFNTLSEIVPEGQAGELALILMTASNDQNDMDHPYKQVTMQAVFSNTTSKLVYLSGSYTYYSTPVKKYSYNYQCTITAESYEKYVKPIVKYTKFEVADENGGTYWKNYYSEANYLIGVESKSSLSSWLFPLILIIVLIVVMYFFYSKMAKSANGGGNPMAGFVNNVARKTTGSKVRFSDVAGCDEAKAELVEMVDYFHSTDKYTRLGAKLPHGVLLVGPPGTGKTLLAKAVAGEASVPFYSISGSDFVEMYVGVGASRVRSLFKTAKQNAPCLIFIDEIDAVGRQRGTGLGGGNDEREQTLNELLVEMDGFEDNNGIIVMAATNRSDVLDPALTRPGRFDRTITVDLPDKVGRAAILKVHAKNKKLAADVNFDSIASRTVGFSGADLANIMNDAAILAVRANRTAITTSDIDEAIDRAIAGPAKRSHLEENEKRQVAYHEAGHAVIGLFLPYSDKVQKITIIPRGRTGGHVLMTPENDRFLMTKNQLLARITGYLGGRTSEEIFFGDVSTGASNDIEVATNIARSMVTEYGMSNLGPIQYEKAGGSVFLGRDYNSTQANYSTQIAFEIDKEIRDIVEKCHADARKLLEEHRDDVTLIAETLIKNETITADQIKYLLENRKLPEVDEHKIESKEGEPKNPNNIILYPGYQSFYHSLDKLLESAPTLIVMTAAVKDGKPLSEEQFREICVSRAKDSQKVGVYLLDQSQTDKVSMSIESFGEHLESYAGVEFLLVKTNESTVRALRTKYQPAPKENRPGVVKEILPSDHQKEEKTDTPDDAQKQE